MSWHGGSRVFESVVQGIEKLESGESTPKDLIVTLAKALEDEGWDVGEAQVGLYGEGSPAREALHEMNVFEICGAEHITNPWQCEERKGHAPATLHMEGRGYSNRTWTEEETAT